MKEETNPTNTSIDKRCWYIKDLETYVTKYSETLDLIFGPRDQRFKFNSICYAVDGPYTFFPECFHLNGDCRIDICISKNSWENCRKDLGPWQIAHECVHLLDPGKFGTVNVLEEGLATWFQNEPCYHDEHIRKFIAKNNELSPAYANAEQLVRSCLPDILKAVKSLRTSGVRIREIKVEMLEPHLKNTKFETLEYLCAQFQN
ncbi:MAG: hypothetical protein OXI60_06730 [Acidiferrobacterales bacterium]|nr:hypothetical protein [Acidiferrobacterales bacterium]